MSLIAAAVVVSSRLPELHRLGENVRRRLARGPWRISGYHASMVEDDLIAHTR
jgi:hypothetical protein